MVVQCPLEKAAEIEMQRALTNYTIFVLPEKLSDKNRKQHKKGIFHETSSTNGWLTSGNIGGDYETYQMTMQTKMRFMGSAGLVVVLVYRVTYTSFFLVFLYCVGNSCKTAGIAFYMIIKEYTTQKFGTANYRKLPVLHTSLQLESTYIILAKHLNYVRWMRSIAICL